MTCAIPSRLAVVLLAASMLTACAKFKPPEIDYDSSVPPLDAPPPPVKEVATPPLHIPPPWTPSRGGATDAAAPEARVDLANAAARVEPRRAGYYNAIQIFPFSEGALYQVYAAPGQITSLSLEPGERLTGSGPIAAGDTARWIIGDTISGSGRDRRVQILVKPTSPDITTNLVINTDRRTYLIELRARAKEYMPLVAWAYPTIPSRVEPHLPSRPAIPPDPERHYRYVLQGDDPPWRPISVFDDRRRVYVVFPEGIVQGEMPPLYVIGADSSAQLVNARVHRNVLIVDRLFAAAELRLGGRSQQVVRIVRSDGRPAP
ncbi:MAG: P-type conjugative transfer protein TrbG [Tabrizicola sp.]|nr:P-type conjugative transfer protein TrbG [Tabrizicola sp.]